MKTKKRLSVLLAVAMVVTMLFGMAAPAAAAQATFSSTFTTQTTGNNKAGGTITVRQSEDPDDAWGDTVYMTVTLPDGVVYNKTPKKAELKNYVESKAGELDGEPKGIVFDEASSKMLRVRVNMEEAGGEVKFKFSGLNIDSGFTGDVRATVDVMAVDEDGSVVWMESATRTIVRVAASAVTVSAAAPNVVQMGKGKDAAKITIQEGAPGSISAGEVRLEILTSGVSFSRAPVVEFGGGTTFEVGPAEIIEDTDDRQAKFAVNEASSVFPGKIEISAKLDINPSVTGEIKIRVRSVGSTGVPSTTLTVATVGTASAEITNVQYNTGSIYAGQAAVIGTSSTNTARFVIKSSAGSKLPQNRIVVLELSEGVKFVDDGFVVEYGDGNGGFSRDDDAVINFYSNNTKAWFETDRECTELRISDFKLAAAGDTGEVDIKVTVSGTMGATGEVTLGKVAKAFKVTTDVAALNYPGLEQAGKDIVITEVAKGALPQGKLYLTLPYGVSFASTPRVRVTEGDLRIDTASVTTTLDGLSVLVIPVTAVSTEASTITVDRVSYNVTRSAMEGKALLKVTGEKAAGKWVDDKVLASVEFATVGVVEEAGPVASVFTIGSLTYYADGKSFTMDVAPIIVNDRTMLPLRFVAQACGLSEDEIIWDPVRRTVTLIRGDRVVQVTIGSTTMLINGAVVTMDVEPQIIDGRTMLPIRWVALALRAEVVWDAANRTVTVTPL